MEAMTTLSVTIPTDHRQQLQVMADHLGLSTEDLVRMSIQSLITSPPPDVAEAIAYVLEKHADLYRRLA
jgi:16S rRNA U516 pseudouridylate synthase RsuA-like enzyme